jgi:hypothetical protein
MSAAPWVKQPTRRQRIVNMVTAQPGITASDVALAFGMSAQFADDELNALAKASRIQKHGQRAGIRWTAVGVELPARLPAAAKNPSPPRRRATGKAGADLVVKGGTVSPPVPRMPKPAAEPIITEKTVRTVAVTPLPRFHVPADFRGAFSLAGVGRDVQTGRGWA